MSQVDLLKAAEIAACLAHFPEEKRGEVVARFGLRWEEWQTAASYWAAEREAEMSAGKVELSSRYARAFAATEMDLVARGASLDSIGPLPRTFRVEPAQEDGLGRPEERAPDVHARQLVPGATPLGAPPYRLAEPTASSLVAHVTARDPEAGVNAGRRPAPASLLNLGAAPPPLAPGRWAGPQGMGETEEVDTSGFKKPALPFAKAEPAPTFLQAVDAARPTAREGADGGNGNETMMLPSVGSLASSARLEAGASTESAVPRPDLAGTSLDLKLPRGPVLPFPSQHARPGEQVPPAREPTSVAAGPVHVATPRASLTGTSLALGKGPGVQLPFATRDAGDMGARPAPDLSLEQYAAFRAKLTLKGETAPEVWAEFGVRSAAAKEALQARFAERFRQDPAAQAHFVELVRGMIQERRGGQ